MMDSPPQLSPPPELKSSLDQSELVVHELTGRTSLISVDLGLAVEGNARTENTKFSRTLLYFSVCLGSLRASRERLNGQNLAAESGLCRQLYRLEPSIVLFKKNDPKPQNAH